MLKKFAMALALLITLVVTVGAIAFRPVEKYQYFQLEGRFRQENYKRYWKILPFSEWSVLPTESVPEGGRDANDKYIRRFGFVSLTEDRWTLSVSTPRAKIDTKDEAIRATQQLNCYLEAVKCYEKYFCGLRL